jgi:hypothetical protein
MVLLRMTVNEINQKRKMPGLNAEVVKSVFKELSEKGYGTIVEKYAKHKNGATMFNKPIFVFERISFEDYEKNTELESLPRSLNILADFVKRLKNQEVEIQGKY